MINKNKINELQEEIKRLKSSNKKLTANMDKILDTLEGKDFSKEWKEYQKYKKMKDELPDIEEMYNLRKLKYLVLKTDQNRKDLKIQRISLLKTESGGDRMSINALRRFIHDNIIQHEAECDEIDNILNYIKEKMNQKNLIGIFKLYGISTEWLKP